MVSVQRERERERGFWFVGKIWDKVDAILLPCFDKIYTATTRRINRFFRSVGNVWKICLFREMFESKNVGIIEKNGRETKCQGWEENIEKFSSRKTWPRDKVEERRIKTFYVFLSFRWIRRMDFLSHDALVNESFFNKRALVAKIANVINTRLTCLK